jgi:hypothetical protein
MQAAGPKMYNSHQTSPDEVHQGSTKLHLDLTDAVNVMLWANMSDSEPAALWHIFWPQDAEILRKFLIQDIGFHGFGDPIHSQMFYLTPSMLHHLHNQHNIQPYTIYQRPGEAIYIPAGAAHQVPLSFL